ncbi:Cleft lip and palate transmembrane 1, partial [Trinorchestia longiramus]
MAQIVPVEIPWFKSDKIKLWKVQKSLRLRKGGALCSPPAGDPAGDLEDATQQLDTQAYRGLCCVLVPLCVAGAVYSLVYMPHKRKHGFCWYCEHIQKSSGQILDYEPQLLQRTDSMALTPGALYPVTPLLPYSWYAWVLECTVHGVYGLGFIFMLPQLFINHKLKSVAHLPWKAFMYK